MCRREWQDYICMITKLETAITILDRKGSDIQCFALSLRKYLTSRESGKSEGEGEGEAKGS